MGCFDDFLLAIPLNSRHFTYPNEQGFNRENLLGNFSEELHWLDITCWDRTAARTVRSLAEAGLGNIVQPTQCVPPIPSLSPECSLEALPPSPTFSSTPSSHSAQICQELPSSSSVTLGWFPGGPPLNQNFPLQSLVSRGFSVRLRERESSDWVFGRFTTMTVNVCFPLVCQAGVMEVKENLAFP